MNHSNALSNKLEKILLSSMIRVPFQLLKPLPTKLMTTIVTNPTQTMKKATVKKTSVPNVKAMPVLNPRLFRNTENKFLNVDTLTNLIMLTACVRTVIMLRVEQRWLLLVSTIVEPSMLRVSARIAI